MTRGIIAAGEWGAGEGLGGWVRGEGRSVGSSAESPPRSPLLLLAPQPPARPIRLPTLHSHCSRSNPNPSPLYPTPSHSIPRPTPPLSHPQPTPTPSPLHLHSTPTPPPPATRYRLHRWCGHLPPLRALFVTTCLLSSSAVADLKAINPYLAHSDTLLKMAAALQLHSTRVAQTARAQLQLATLVRQLSDLRIGGGGGGGGGGQGGRVSKPLAPGLALKLQHQAKAALGQLVRGCVSALDTPRYATPRHAMSCLAAPRQARPGCATPLPHARHLPRCFAPPRPASRRRPPPPPPPPPDQPPHHIQTASRHCIDNDDNDAAQFAVDPRFLIFEYLFDLLLRKRQVAMVCDFRNKAMMDLSSCQQMIMGAGKTTVVGPLLTLCLADGDCLVMQVRREGRGGREG